jgi:vanillate O-demethylase monooxygenase subunit
VLLPVDAGAVRCRRVLRRLIEAERAAPHASPLSSFEKEESR